MSGLAILAGCRTDTDYQGGPGADLPASNGIPVLFLAGDSTVHTYGIRLGWGDVIQPLFDGSRIAVTNHARGGRSSRTFQTEGWWGAILASSKPGDFVLIQFGHNDGGPLDDTNRARGTLPGVGPETRAIFNPIRNTNEVVHTYGWYLRKYVSDAREVGMIPILCSPVPRLPRWPARPMDVDDYAIWAGQVAMETGTPFVDLHKLVLGRYAGLTTNEIKAIYFTPQDNTHTGLAGAQLNAFCVVEGLRQLKACRLKDYLLPDSPPIGVDGRGAK